MGCNSDFMNVVHGFWIVVDCFIIVDLLHLFLHTRNFDLVTVTCMQYVQTSACWF